MCPTYGDQIVPLKSRKLDNPSDDPREFAGAAGEVDDPFVADPFFSKYPMASLAQL